MIKKQIRQKLWYRPQNSWLVYMSEWSESMRMQLLGYIKRVVFCAAKRSHLCTCLLFERSFSVHHALRSPKKKTTTSPYGSVDSGRYSSLVKAVVSTKISSQTPESIEEENSHIYGPVVKSHNRTSKPKVPKHVHPFLNCDNDDDGAHGGELFGPPARISLERHGKISVPSVTRILQDTLSPLQRFYLERWKRRMIADLGEEGFKEYSLNLFRQGGLFHNALDDLLTQDATETKTDVIPAYPTEIEGYMESIGYILEDISGVRAIESTVHHGTLDYRGIVDCVACYRGVLCVIEWKTSERSKPHLSHTYDNPIQVAAYAGALNGDNNYKYKVENGLIVVAYKDGSPAHAHPLNSTQMLDYWERWLVRLEEYTEKKSQ